MAKVSTPADAEKSPRFLFVRASLWSLLRLFLCFLISLCAYDSAAQEVHPTESQVEAAYLFNFGKFVTWPSTRSADSFGVCILGKDPFGEALDATVTGESIDHKQIKVLRISRMPEADACNILFVSSSEEAHLAAILSDAQKFHWLTVSDMKHFAERGGDIGMLRQENRVRFEVNRSAAEQSSLVLSSELLKVATRVIQNKAGK